MRSLNFSPYKIITGRGSLEALKSVDGNRFLIVTGGQSMRKSGVLDRMLSYLDGRAVHIYEGVSKNPTINEVYKGLAHMHAFQPDTLIAVGGGSAMDVAKSMIVFYEHPDLSFESVATANLPERREKVHLIAIPSTSGTASEVTKSSVITDPKRGIKVPINCMANKPDIAILDSDLTMTLPDNVVAETGMDALTHAVECYLRVDCDDFDAVLAQGAILGIMEWLPVSYKEKGQEAREKMHNYQCIAGLAFTNGGLTMVHGISHAFGGIYNYAHGLSNAVVLPYVLKYNLQVASVAKKQKKLAHMIGCDDFIAAVENLKEELNIPKTIRDMGLDEETYQRDRARLAASSLMGPTKFNPVKMDEHNILEVLDQCYYGV